ncbi:hypothetical protein BKA56DRAFT_563572 [Ilyonectria sp. MPI-CAGE-AT-0026]|nr:hypothetical protein BKA56DRAFT_563572 [Ilyonectria sp. MPI-CAGE-AT-0026]
MALDPVSALSIAAAVVQFVDFSRKIVSKSKHLYHSTAGALRENIETETVTMRLKDITDHLRTTAVSSALSGTTPSVARIEQIRTECFQVSEQLLQKLHQLKVPTTSRFRTWKSFRQALKSVWSKSDIDAMASRLAVLRAQLDTEVLVLSNEILVSLASSQDSRFEAVEEQTQSILHSLAECQAYQSRLVERFDQLGSSNKSIFMDLVLESVEDSEEYAKLDTTTKRIIKVLIEQRSNDFKDNDNLRKRRRKDAEDFIAQDTEKRAFRAHRVIVSILESLRFPEMNHRHESISQAEHETFNWVFKNPTEHQKPWNSLSDWLSTKSGIYWIQGKPASGKSTLMRFICECSETEDLLRNWSFGRELLLGKFYFWNSGTGEQRSHSGLLRTLLYCILHKKQEITFQVFPEEWERNRDMIHAEMPLMPEKWSLGRLKHAFKTLISLAGPELKICCFIDGLDEYDGDAGDIADYIYQVAPISPNVKFCVSGRPLSEFQATFWDCPGLRLQDLTEGDITQFVHRRLGEDRRMQRLSRYDRNGAEAIFNEITKRASGVFLWVVLVVRSLISGLRQGDNMVQLRARLDSLPVDLERLFKVILDGIEPDFRVESSKIFQIYRASGNDLDAVELYRILLHENYRSLISMDLEHDTGDGTAEHLQIEELIELVEEQMTLKLSSRCRGLLEMRIVHTSKGYDLSPGLGSGLMSNFMAPRHLKIEYLHRTARDFVEQQQQWSQVILPTENTDFDPHVARLLGYVAGAKMTRFEDVSSGGFKLLADISRLHLSASAETVALMDELDRILSFRWKERFKEMHWSCFNAKNEERARPIWGDDIISAAAQCDIFWFVEAKEGLATKARKERRKLHEMGHPNASPVKSRLPFLAYAVSLPQWAATTYPAAPNLNQVRKLLAQGCSPNETYHGFSVWGYTLHRVHTLAFIGFAARGQLEMWLEVFKEMLNAGADPHAFCVFDPMIFTQAVGYSDDPKQLPTAVIKHVGESFWSPEMMEGDGSEIYDHFVCHHSIDRVIADVFGKKGLNTEELKILLKRVDPNRAMETKADPAPEASGPVKRKTREDMDGELVLRKRHRPCGIEM